MNYILLYNSSCNNFAYQKTLIYIIYPRIITKVDVSATVEECLRQWGEMSAIATVEEMSATVEECPRQWGEMSATVEEMSATVEKLNML